MENPAGILGYFYFNDSDAVAGVFFYGNRHEPPEREMVRRIAKLQVAYAASVLQRGGLPALNAMTANWSETDKSHFSVLPVAQITPVTALSSDKVQPLRGAIPSFTAGK